MSDKPRGNDGAFDIVGKTETIRAIRPGRRGDVVSDREQRTRRATHQRRFIRGYRYDSENGSWADVRLNFHRKLSA